MPRPGTDQPLDETGRWRDLLWMARRASVVDTRHERGKSSTRKTIPCVDVATAIGIAAELNAGIVTINQ